MAIGGNFSGSINGSQVQGILLYDVSNAAAPTLLNKQPEISEGSADNGVIGVNAVTFKPNSSDLVVAGSYSVSLGANGSCNSACLYNLEESQWMTGLGLNGNSVVNDVVFETGDNLVIAGQFSSSDGSGQLAVYDFRNRSIKYLPPLSGQVSKVVVLSNATGSSEYAVAGNADMSQQYLRWYDGSQWQDLSGNPLQRGTVVSDISLIPLSSPQESSSGSPFSSEKALLVSGDLRTSSGNLTMLIYDGTNWIPWYAASEEQGSSIPTTVSAVVAQRGGNLKGGVQYSESSQPKSSQTGSPKPSQSGNGHPHSDDNKMPTGHVVGIACAIGVGCIMLLTLLYLLCEWLVTRGQSNPVYQNLAQSKPASDAMSGTKVVK